MTPRSTPGSSATRPVQTSGGTYTFSISGPGLMKVAPLGKGLVRLTLFGTTGATTLTESQTRQRLHQASAGLKIGAIRVISGTIGGIDAPDAALYGGITPVSGVSTLQFGSLQPNARIDVNGALGSLTVGSIDLAPNGHVNIGGDLGQSLNVGSLNLDGGHFTVGNDLTGALDVGSIRSTRAASSWSTTT